MYCDVTDRDVKKFWSVISKHNKSSSPRVVFDDGVSNCEKIVSLLPPSQCLNGYTITGLLGKGTKGWVFAMVNEAGMQVAIKVGFTTGAREIRHMRRFEEVGLAPRILCTEKYHFKRRNIRLIVMERVDFTLGTLLDKYASDPVVLNILAVKVSDALNVMSAAGIKHGDFHHENIAFVQSSSGDPSDYSIRILDYGRSIAGIFETDAQRFLNKMRNKRIAGVNTFDTIIRQAGQLPPSFCITKIIGLVMLGMSVGLMCSLLMRDDGLRRLGRR